MNAQHKLVGNSYYIDARTREKTLELFDIYTNNNGAFFIVTKLGDCDFKSNWCEVVFWGNSYGPQKTTRHVEWITNTLDYSKPSRFRVAGKPRKQTWFKIQEKYTGYKAMSKQSFIEMLNLYGENEKLAFTHRRLQDLNQRLKDWEAYKNDVSKIYIGIEDISLLKLCDCEISMIKEEMDYINTLLVFE